MTFSQLLRRYPQLAAIQQAAVRCHAEHEDWHSAWSALRPLVEQLELSRAAMRIAHRELAIIWAVGRVSPDVHLPPRMLLDMLSSH